MNFKIEPDELLNFTRELLGKSGVDAKEASVISEIMVWNDRVGRFPYGIWRLPSYLKRFSRGLVSSPCNSIFTKKSDVIYNLNGRNGFGYYLGHKAMNKAIRVAKKHGVGLVGVRRSNHFGAGAYFTEMASRSGQIGLALSNAVPLVAPYGGISKTLGTNPFAFSAPVRNGNSIIVDFSTSSISGSRIKKSQEANKKIPDGFIVDDEGKSITDPNLASTGIILPAGGAIGYCIGIIVEMLSGVLSGSGISHEVASFYKNFDRESNLGQFYMTIDISRVMPLEEYYDRVSKLISFIKQSKKMGGFDEILIPGETRWRFYQKSEKEGIELDDRTIEAVSKVAKELGVSVPW